MNRSALSWVLVALASLCSCTSTPRPPNILLILTDDLGYAEVGCYGQSIIKTPNIDALAAAGTRFTDAYSGSPVCAPSRCCLLTGLHTGHAAIRDNKELQPEGQEPLPASSTTIAQLLRGRGYATAAVGKWGLGPPGSSGDPLRHGFDHFFGYLCQRHAHNYCPPYLYRDDQRFELPGNQARYASGDQIGPVYAPDLMLDEAVSFITSHRNRPFFLLFATPVPHVALQVPDDSLAQYKGMIADSPYAGGKGYLPHSNPHAAYAAMVSRMDRDVGSLLQTLKDSGLDRNTIVIFSSDNGPTWAGGADSTFFKSTGGLRGLKGQLYEGGIRVPLIIRWPGTARAGAVSTEPCAIWDLFPTLADAAETSVPDPIDGVSLLPELTGRGTMVARDHLYWEYASEGGWQAVRIGNFKGVRKGLTKNSAAPLELYDLSSDPAESRDIARAHPGVVLAMERVIAARTPSPIPEWNFPAPASSHP